MGFSAGLFASIWTKIGDVLSGFFAIIPQMMYFIYTCIASLLDMFQFIFRKLAGLDSYYYNGSPRTGDIVVDFIEGILGINNEYSALNTVFWSMIIFGVIVLILMTILTLIKAHYNYDSTKSSPSYIIKQAVKSIFTMALVPLCTLFGLYLAQALFKVLDSFTGQSSSNTLEATFENDAIGNFDYSTGDGDARYYASYDFFGEREWANSMTFSGAMFNVCANQANRVRYGAYTANGNGWDNMGVFYTLKTENVQEKVASQIDYAFSNSLTLTNSRTITVADREEAETAIASSLTYGPSATFAAGLINVRTFSKYNVGLVWYYYNLWSFNFILGFIGIVVCVTLFSNILFGLIMRIIFSAALLLIFPPIVGIMPFDDGNGFKNWRKSFVSYLISAYTSVIAMNILFALLPVFLSIQFFNITLIDGIVQMLIIMAGLSMVKRFISIISSFVGAKDLNELGQSAKKAASQPLAKATGAAVGLAGLSLGAMRLGNKAIRGVSKKAVGAAAKGASAIKGKITASRGWQKLAGTRLGQAAGNFTGKVKGTATKVATKVSDFGHKVGRKLSNAAQKVGKVVTKGKNALNRALDSKAGKAVAGMLGLPTDPHNKEDYEEWVDPEDGQTYQVLKQTDEERAAGNPRVKKVSGLGIIKNQMVDVSKVAFKAIGSLMGFKQAFDKLNEGNKGFDMFKSQANDLARDIGLRQEGQKPIFKTQASRHAEEVAKKVTQAVPMIDADLNSSQKALSKVQQLVSEISAHPDDYL